MNPTKWYGLKTVWRFHAVGRPKHVDADYDHALEVMEERVVMVQATSPSEAFAKCIKEGRRYAARGASRNIYGQRIVVERLRHIECFECDEDAGDVREVYSEMFETRARNPQLLAARRLFAAAGRVGSVGKSDKIIDGRIVRALRRAYEGEPGGAGGGDSKPLVGVGDTVTLKSAPSWLRSVPKESRAVIRYCVGRAFRITEITESGLVVLDVHEEVDKRFGGCMSDLRVEASLVAPVAGSELEYGEVAAVKAKRTKQDRVDVAAPAPSQPRLGLRARRTRGGKTK